ncbi:M23 family metallopeptidase, partial [Campylobacter upsaliensis]
NEFFNQERRVPWQSLIKAVSAQQIQARKQQ